MDKRNLSANSNSGQTVSSCADDQTDLDDQRTSAVNGVAIEENDTVPRSSDQNQTAESDQPFEFESVICPSEDISIRETHECNRPEPSSATQEDDRADRDIESIFNRLNRWLDGESAATTTNELEVESHHRSAEPNELADERPTQNLPQHSSQIGISELAIGEQGDLGFQMNAESTEVSNRGSSSQDSSDANSVLLQLLEEFGRRLEISNNQRLDSIERNFQAAFDSLVKDFAELPQLISESVKLALDQLCQHPAPHPIAPSTAPITEESNWETRKRHMLSQFGLSSEEIEQMVPGRKDSTNQANVKKGGNTKDIGKVEDHALEALQSSIETLDKIDIGFSSAEIDELKEQLTAKLREAEVELSINRAKLSKEWAALEQKVAEVTQREAALKSKYYDADTSNKKGLLDRISRHLSRKS
jgi:hypothetical protein